MPSPRALRVCRSAVRALSITSSAMPMSLRYLPVCCCWRCLEGHSAESLASDAAARSRPHPKTLATPASQRRGKRRSGASRREQNIPQQRVVGRMMNVRSAPPWCRHAGFWPSSRPSPTAACTTRSLIGLSVFGVSRLKPRLNASCRGTGRPIEVGELAQCASVGNPLAQFTIVPVLDAHQNQRAQHLLWRRPLRRLGLLQPRVRSRRTCSDHVLLVVQKIGKWSAAPAQVAGPGRTSSKIGKTDLPLPLSGTRSAPIALFWLRCAPRFSALMYREAAWCSRSCRRAPLSRLRLNLRHKLFRHVDGNATPVRATVEHINLMLFARLARRAIVANDHRLRRTAQQPRSAGQRLVDSPSQPARDIRRRFRINMLHIQECDTMHMYVARKTRSKIAITLILKGEMPFATEN